jgi:tripartite-type tricarboxylate transporter receptor subunit TctC
VAVTPSVVLAHPRTGARTLEDFLTQARARPGALACAHAGNGTPGHLSAVLLQMAAGLRLSLVGYRGAGPAAAALVAGEAPFGFSAIPTVKGHVEAGLLCALAVAGERRNPALPEVPTFAELGWPQVDAPSIYGVFAPAHLPDAIVQRLNALMVQPAADAAVRARLEPLGYGVIAGSAEDYATLIRTAIPKWREVIATAGVRPD